jgi:hypothetical protein
MSEFHIIKQSSRKRFQLCPHDLGISAITFWLENKRNIVQDRFSKEFILETVTIILERNVFYFDGKFYRVGK